MKKPRTNVATLGAELLRELAADPRRFVERGRSHDLLQLYFDGLSVETLRPFVVSDDEHIRRSVAFILSELGARARPLVADVGTLLASSVPRVRADAMDVLTVCSVGEHAQLFAHVVRGLDDADPAFRAHAMDLVANADASQLDAARRTFEASSGDHPHVSLLERLVGAEIAPASVSQMLRAPGALERRYGAIAAARVARRAPAFLDEAAASEDEGVRAFAERQRR